MTGSKDGSLARLLSDSPPDSVPGKIFRNNMILDFDTYDYSKPEYDFLKRHETALWHRNDVIQPMKEYIDCQAIRIIILVSLLQLLKFLNF